MCFVGCSGFELCVCTLIIQLLCKQNMYIATLTSDFLLLFSFLGWKCSVMRFCWKFFILTLAIQLLFFGILQNDEANLMGELYLIISSSISFQAKDIRAHSHLLLMLLDVPGMYRCLGVFPASYALLQVIQLKLIRLQLASRWLFNLKALSICSVILWMTLCFFSPTTQNTLKALDRDREANHLLD